MSRAERRGFTLVEVLVALAIGGTVLLGARALLEGVGDHASRSVAEARDADREANGEYAARSIVARLRLADPEPGLVGEPRAAHFASWCDTPHGWLEPCLVRLAVEPDGDRGQVVMRLSTGERLVLRRGAGDWQLRYLASAAAGGEWHGRWTALAEVPLALAVVSERDTQLLRIGERR